MRRKAGLWAVLFLAGVLTPAAVFSQTASYGYDKNGNRTGMSDPAGATAYEYDSLNRLISLSNSAIGTILFEYDALGRRTVVNRPNGLTTEYTYDAVGNLKSLAQSTFPTLPTPMT